MLISVFLEWAQYYSIGTIIFVFFCNPVIVSLVTIFYVFHGVCTIFWSHTQRGHFDKLFLYIMFLCSSNSNSVKNVFLHKEHLRDGGRFSMAIKLIALASLISLSVFPTVSTLIRSPDSSSTRTRGHKSFMSVAYARQFWTTIQEPG